MRTTKTATMVHKDDDVVVDDNDDDDDVVGDDSDDDGENSCCSDGEQRELGFQRRGRIAANSHRFDEEDSTN